MSFTQLILHSPISFLARTARRLQEQYPLIHYHIYSGDSDLVREKLEKGLIDFGLLVGTDISDYNYIKLPVQDTCGLMMREDSELAGKDVIRPGDLWDKPLIMPRQPYFTSLVFSWLGVEPAQLQVVATYNLLYNAAQFAKHDFGYVVTLDKIVNTAGAPPCFRHSLRRWVRNCLSYGKSTRSIPGRPMLF